VVSRGYSIEVVDVLERARPADAGWVKSSDLADPWAARLRIVAPGGETTEGWCSAASWQRAPQVIQGNAFAVGLQTPAPRAFSSDVALFAESDVEARHTTVEVNRPVRHEGWWVYQVDYDANRGPASDWSEFEAVRDPWFPVIQASIIAICIGCALALFPRLSRKESHAKP
jgi:hypothetical protein